MCHDLLEAPTVSQNPFQLLGLNQAKSGRRRGLPEKETRVPYLGQGITEQTN